MVHRHAYQGSADVAFRRDIYKGGPPTFFRCSSSKASVHRESAIVRCSKILAISKGSFWNSRQIECVPNQTSRLRTLTNSYAVQFAVVRRPSPTLPLRSGDAGRRVAGKIVLSFRLQDGSQTTGLLACPSRGPDASGPHGNGARTRRSAALDAVDLGGSHGLASLVGNSPPSATRRHSATGYDMRCAPVGSPSFSRLIQRPYQTLRHGRTRETFVPSCGRYARTVRGETKIPNFAESSAAMRSSPQVGFSRTMRTISWRRASGIRGLPNRDFHRQNSLNPLRCQPMRVSGLTIIRAAFQLHS
jgi:hypothetical protein